MPLLLRATAAAFDALGRLRRAPAFHPRGALFAARVELTEAAAPTVAALGGPGTHPGLARLSKGAGTPGALPDLLGVAVRLPDVPDGPVDLLFTTVGRHRRTRFLLAPAAGWGTRPYSTLLPYRADGVRVTLGLEPERPERARAAEPQAAREAVRSAPLVFTLVEKRAGAPWTPVGRLVVDLPLPDAHADDGSAWFDPIRNAHPRLRPVRPLARLRAAAYTGSRQGRRAGTGAPVPS
jgi:hypothetical protein